MLEKLLSSIVFSGVGSALANWADKFDGDKVAEGGGMLEASEAAASLTRNFAWNLAALSLSRSVFF